ncbi:nesprin-4 [Varanus komodoensis]|uniref:nesprin-4 n=1 Tax=Varanus komodoensis TaxID=61221 RepID=UPI001CF77400|nr:nesprin-4 [Varanus komodoensis]
MRQAGFGGRLCPDPWKERRCRKPRGEPLTEPAACHLCLASVERRIREEQAWQEKVALQDLVFRFQDWLRAAEATVRSARSSQVSYAHSKKELQRCEVLQKQLSDKLLLLETLNRHYRQLGRSGGTCARLRSAVQELNRHCDELQRRAAAVHAALRRVVNEWEEFQLERESMRVWLMELDLRLTDVEHFSGGTALDKMIRLQACKQDVQANAERLDRLLERGERLIQSSQPEDARRLEEELQALSSFCQEVFRRVFHFRRRLVSLRLVFEDEWLSDRESDLESDCVSADPPELDHVATGAAHPPVCPLSQPPPGEAPSPCCQAPAPHAGGTLDLEWDPSVDVGGSTSHDEEDSSYYSAITGVGPWEEPRRRCKPSSAWGSRSLPLRCSSQEDFFAQEGVFQGAWNQSSCSGADRNMKRCSSGDSHPWEVAHPPNLLPEEAGRRPAEPVGFDPKRIETWLGQNCQEKMGQDARTRVAFQPVGALRLPETGGNQPKRQKPPQRTEKRSKPPLQPGPGSRRQISRKKQPGSRPAESAVTVERGCDPPRPLDLSARAQKFPGIRALRNKVWLLFPIALLLLLLLLLLQPTLLPLSEPPCLRANRYARSFHLTLKHRGPPPT